MKFFYNMISVRFQQDLQMVRPQNLYRFMTGFRERKFFLYVKQQHDYEDLYAVYIPTKHLDIIYFSTKKYS